MRLLLLALIGMAMPGCDSVATDASAASFARQRAPKTPRNPRRVSVNLTPQETTYLVTVTFSQQGNTANMSWPWVSAPLDNWTADITGTATARAFSYSVDRDDADHDWRVCVSSYDSATGLSSTSAACSNVFTVPAYVLPPEPPLPPDSVCADCGGPNGPTGDWTLTFQDEFDGTELDPTKWNTALPWSNTIINNELQFYDNCPYGTEPWIDVCSADPGSHTVVQDGTLRLIATQDTQWIYWNGGQDSLRHDYTSGAVNSKYRVEMQEGVIEFRASAAPGRGFVSSLWLFGEGPWEIDITEVLGLYPNRSHDGIFWAYDGASHDTGHTDLPQDLTVGMHTFTAEWNPTTVTFYVDGVQTRQVTGHSPTVPMYVIMNLSIGAWGGIPDGSTTWPGVLEIDYVRVWQ